MRRRFWWLAVVLAACTLIGGASGALAAAGPGTAQAGGAESTGWAGYELSGADGVFSSVSAGWTEPGATCVKGDQDVAFWVGLDGISSDSVEQIGTEADCTSGAASYLGWYDMYPASPVYFSNPVEPGDVLSASVTFSSTETYTLVLADATQGWTKTVTLQEAGLARSSAEVVTSGPGADSSTPELTDFTKVTYTGCTVNGVSLGTQSPVKVTMVDDKGNVMVLPSAITSAGKFNNTWERGD